MKTFGVALGLAAIISSIPLSVARSWVAPKPSVTVFNQVKAKNDSVIFSFVKFTTESPTDIEVDGSDSAFILEFGKDIGAVSKEECLDQQCWKWTQGGDDVATLTAMVDTNSQQQTVYTKIHFAGMPGLTHSYRFSHRGEYLYGGPIDDIYPSNKDMKKNAPYITSEGGKKAPNKANAVAERVWYTSGGRGIQVSDDTPLFVSQDENSLILTVKNQLPYSTKAETIQSQITMVSTRNIKEAWLMLNAGKRTPSPPEIVVKKPLISTWVAFKSNITQEKVLGFVRGLKDKNVDVGVIGVDDGWESCYGSQIFDKKKFPNPKAMVDEIHKLGHKVTLWVHPFVNTACEAHERLKDHLLKYDNGSIVTTTWWNSPTAGMIDFRNATAATFFVDRLRKLQKDYGIDGFKFDAGEVSYIPQVNQGLEIPEPNDWTKSYVMMASLFGPLGEVRVGASTSYADVRLRMEDTNSVWDVHNHGLQAVIPAMLQMTVSGYAATIPDFIGGNSYGEQVCDKEMFIRWTQLNTFLPAMQFSILPWSFDDEVLNLTKKYIALHEQYSPYMMDLYYDVDPTPVVAPLWWIDPYAKEALTCTDEFLVGNSILAAPVVEKGVNKRDIYFPSGLWKDLETGKTYEGPATVKNFEAPLTRLPWFVRQRFAAK